VEKTNICLIPNGVNLDDYEFDDHIQDALELRKLVGVGDSPFLLFLGRLNPIKGPDILVDAFAILSSSRKDLHLIMAGPDDGMLAELQSRVSVLGIEQRVHFPGFINGAIKAAALRDAEMLVIPSRREAMSIVVLEGGACGCPVVFTDACGLENLVQRGAGIMVEVSVDALANALKKLLKDYETCRGIALQLQQIVHQEYTWSVQAARHIELFEHVLATRRKSCEG
jgi:glycosyltransferase involved in cell wall biosynthesis